VGDFRLSLSVSARVAGVPYVNVTNAYWSPFARPDMRMPALPWSRFVPEFVGDALFRVASAYAFSAHAEPLNKVRSEYGFDTFSDIRFAYCDGDLTLYSDIPELIPTFDLPESHRYIGAPLWEPTVERPVWLQRTLANRFVYVSLGTSGRSSLLPLVIEALAPFELPIVAATMNSNLRIPRVRNVLTAEFLPGHEIASKAAILICNGGSPSAQQALCFGVPVLGIASNLDQFMNMSYIERFGAGALIRADRASVRLIRTKVAELLEVPWQRARARELSKAFRRIDPRVEFPRAMAEVSCTAG
jgi:UDP:flavonoid glycosyltransferase YjiC (YdhE family)